MREGPRAAWAWRAAGLAVALSALAPACVLATEGQATSSPPVADAAPPEADADVPDASAGVERCEDDIDDDGDGLVDCADPDCAPEYVCVDTPPESWEGPLWIRAAPWDEPATPCRGGIAPRGLAMGDPADARCSPCACGDLAGATCDPPRLHCRNGALDCVNGDEVDLTAEVTAAACLSKPAQAGLSACWLAAGATVSSQGGCPPQGGELAPTPPVPARVDRCASATRLGGCAAGHACTRRPAPDYADHGVCILRAGAFEACPASFPDERVVVWQDMRDDRGCEACTCATKGTKCEGGGYTVFGCGGCAGGAGCAAVPVTPMCLPMSGFTIAAWSIEAKAPTLTPGACEAQGGAPRGAVHAEGQMTFCCKR